MTIQVLKETVEPAGLFDDTHAHFWKCPDQAKMRGPTDSQPYRIGIQKLVDKQKLDHKMLVDMKNKRIEYKKSQRETELAFRAMEEAARFGNEKPAWDEPGPGDYFEPRAMKTDMTPSENYVKNPLLQGMWENKEYKPCHWEQNTIGGWNYSGTNKVGGTQPFGRMPVEQMGAKSLEIEERYQRRLREIQDDEARDAEIATTIKRFNKNGKFLSPKDNPAPRWQSTDASLGYFQKPVYNGITGMPYQDGYLKEKICAPLRAHESSCKDFICGNFYHDYTSKFWRPPANKSSSGKNVAYIESLFQLPRSKHVGADVMPPSVGEHSRMRRTKSTTFNSSGKSTSSHGKAHTGKWAPIATYSNYELTNLHSTLCSSKDGFASTQSKEQEGDKENYKTVTTLPSISSPKTRSHSISSKISTKSFRGAARYDPPPPPVVETMEIRVAFQPPGESTRKVVAAHVDCHWTVQQVINVVAEAGKDHLSGATLHPNPGVAAPHSHVRLMLNTEFLPLDRAIGDVALRAPPKCTAGKWPLLYWTFVTLPPNVGGAKLTQLPKSQSMPTIGLMA